VPCPGTTPQQEANKSRSYHSCSIGGACARVLAALGIHLALHYSASRDKCSVLADALRKEYPALKITTHRADMSSAEETVNLCHEAAAAHGQAVLILVANAGVGKKIPHIKCVHGPLPQFNLSTS